MGNEKNWPGYGDNGTAITASGTSAATLFVKTRLEQAGDDIMVWNPGPHFVMIKTGGPTVEATPLSIPCPPGELSPYRRGKHHEHVAVICPTGFQNIIVFAGDGA